MSRWTLPIKFWLLTTIAEPTSIYLIQVSYLRQRIENSTERFEFVAVVQVSYLRQRIENSTERFEIWGYGASLVVSMLAFYSDEPCLNPADLLSFLLNNVSKNLCSRHCLLRKMPTMNKTGTWEPQY